MTEHRGLESQSKCTLFVAQQVPSKGFCRNFKKYMFYKIYPQIIFSLKKN